MRSLPIAVFFQRCSAAAAGLGLLAACAPELNWRAVALPPPAELQALFPCKPRHQTRSVPLNGKALAMSMYSCEAGGSTYALAWATADPGLRVEDVLEAWKSASSANLGAAAESRPPPRGGLPGMQRHALHGKFPDGTSVDQETAAFSKGLQVFQAAILGPRIDSEAAAFFFESFK